MHFDIEQYRQKRGSVMERFASLPSFRILQKGGRHQLIIRSEPGYHTEEKAAGERDLLESLRACLAEDLEIAPGPVFNQDFLFRPDPEPHGGGKLPKVPSLLVDPDKHWSRLEAIVDKLTGLPVSGLCEFRSTPAGWVRIMEDVADGFAALCAREPSGRIEIRQIKEKFGTLRLYLQAQGSDAFTSDAHQIARWAEAASEGRCAVTGRPGSRDSAGWILTLCAEAMVWRRIHEEEFRAAMYPGDPRPKDPVHRNQEQPD